MTFAVVYVGHGWVVPSKDVDPYAGVDVKGKLVLAHGPRALPRGIEIPQLGRITVGASNVVAEAARRGAAGVVFIPHDVTRRSVDRDADAEPPDVASSTPPVPSAYAAAPSTAILLSRGATEALFNGEKVSGADLLTRGATSDYLPSFELARRVTLSLPARTTVHRPYNVVAVIEGTDPVLKNEYITIESHLDGAVGHSHGQR